MACGLEFDRNSQYCYHNVAIVAMKSNTLIRTQIQLTDSQARELKRLAAARHVSMAELVRQGVDSVLRSNTIMDVAEKRKRALALAGKFRSGKHDVSREHDRYLAEDYSK